VAALRCAQARWISVIRDTVTLLDPDFVDLQVRDVQRRHADSEIRRRSRLCMALAPS
jgi:hypothetical protein